jgi:hypothetical protein
VLRLEIAHGGRRTIQAGGDRPAAEALLARLGVIRPEVRDRLAAIPVDIAPRFPAAKELARR